MDIEGLISAASAGIGAAIAVGAVMRRYWAAREVRQQNAFRQAVEQIVDGKTEQIIVRQIAFEKRQGAHLDRQDRAIAAIGREVRAIRGRHDS